MPTLIAALLATAAGCDPPPNREVRLASRVLVGGFDPAFEAALQSSAPGKVHGVLRFRTPLTAEQHRALRDSGVVLLGYLGDDSYFAAVPTGSVLGEGSLATLGGADLLTAQDKIDARLRGPPPWWIRRGPDRIAVVIELFGDVDSDHAVAPLLGVAPGAVRLGPVTWSLEVSPTDLPSIARLDEVKRIHPGRIPPLPLTDVQRAAMRTDVAQDPNFAPPRPTYRVDGSPIRVAICDDGISVVHRDFKDITTTGSLGAVRVAPKQAYGNDHGTHVASIVAGSGHGSAANKLAAFARRGHAPYAWLGDFSRFGSDLQATYEALVDGKMQLSNHSYVQSEDAPIAYDTVAAELDAIVRGGVKYGGFKIPARPQVWAAGNNGVKAQYSDISAAAGYFSVFASAKNTIAVGSVNAPYDDLSGFSSLGPTLDGRIKPDLVAPGWRPSTGIKSAIAGYVNGYSGAEGTSFAAPAVAGTVVLVMHQLQMNGVDPDALLPSTYKAFLVHAAKDLSHTTPRQGAPIFTNPDIKEQPTFHPGPDFATGWGRVDAEATRALAAHRVQWLEDGLELAGAAATYCIAVPSNTGELKVTLVWDDLPAVTGVPQTTSKLVNDLDLTVKGPGPSGKTVLPWTVEPPPIVETIGKGIEESFTAADVKPAERGVDRRNNVEMVVESAPSQGTWKAVVTAYRLPMGTAQRYSLVASHALSRECP